MLAPTLLLTTLLALACGSHALAPPTNYGILVLPTWEPIDIAGPLDPLQILAHTYKLNLYLISHAAGPVSSEPQSAAMNPFNSSFWPVLQATHAYGDVPDDLEVLIIPGGPSVRNPDTTPEAVDFIRARYPKLRYLLTVCTGAGLAAKAGVLDGRRATTNKAAWELITGWGPDVKWVSPARWIVDGNVWTSSGGTAGIDLIYAFIAEMFSKADAEHISLLNEHPLQEDNCIDLFGVQLNITTAERCRV